MSFGFLLHPLANQPEGVLWYVQTLNLCSLIIN